MWAALGAPSMQQRASNRATGARRVAGRAGRAGCRAARRAPEGVHAGLFVANRPSARAARRERRRGATEGAAGLRRATAEGQQEARGARQRVALCFGICGGRVRLASRGVRRARATAFLNCVNGFATVRKRVVQANACSGRPRRDPPGCGADGPAQDGPPRGRSRDRALLNWIDARVPRSSGSLPCQCGAHSVRRRRSLSLLRAARGQRVLCGTEWTLCAPIGGAALRGSAASPVPAARAPAFARERARVRPEPIVTLRTHVLQPPQRHSSSLSKGVRTQRSHRSHHR